MSNTFIISTDHVIMIQLYSLNSEPYFSFKRQDHPMILVLVKACSRILQQLVAMHSLRNADGWHSLFSDCSGSRALQWKSMPFLLMIYGYVGTRSLVTMFCAVRFVWTFVAILLLGSLRSFSIL